jgi:hypothetical protein
MALEQWLVSGGVVLAVALIGAPQRVHAQAIGSTSAARALLGVPAAPNGIVNVQVRSVVPPGTTVRSDAWTATPAERALLGMSSGLRVTLHPDAGRSPRSAGESALLGR